MADAPLHLAPADIAAPAAAPAAPADPAVQHQLRAKVRDSPACLASLAGPAHLVAVTNPAFRELFGLRLLAGLPLREALPELADQPFFAALDDAYRTGTTGYSHQAVACVDPAGRYAPLYFTFMVQAVRDAAGAVTGLLLFAYNVSAHEQARQRAEAGGAPPLDTAYQLAVANEALFVSNEELATTVEELSITNEQLKASNDDIRARARELRLAHKALRQLNGQLEARVAERTAQLAAALGETEQQRATIAAVFEQTPAAVCLLRGPQHRFEYVNSRFQLFYPDRHLLGRPVAEALPEAHAQGFVSMLDAVFATGETHHGQEVPLTDIGPHGPRERFFDFTYQAFRENGAIVGVGVFAFDVTEQVRIRQQVAVAVFRGPRYVIELANPAVCKIWGRTADQVLGKPLFEALPEAAGQGFEELLDGVLATGEPYVARELPSTLDRGGRRDTVYWNFVYQPLPDAEGRVTGITMVATDVTEQVTARQELERVGQELTAAYLTLQTAHVDTELANAALHQSNDRLTRTNQDLDSFVYASSHDLKLPVLNLAGLFDELRRGVTFTDPDEEQVLVPLIQDALRQLTTTLDDLAALGQAQQVIQAPAEPVDLAALVADVLQALEPQVRAARARVTTDFAARPTLLYPRAGLRTIVLNLLSNALRYADPARPARIHCSLWLDAGQPVLWVKDNGLGFDATGHGPELFQLFRRFHDHTEGTGVGLYLVNRLVQAHGGHLEVDSQVGEGATFRVYLGTARPAAGQGPGGAGTR